MNLLNRFKRKTSPSLYLAAMVLLTGFYLLSYFFEQFEGIKTAEKIIYILCTGLLLAIFALLFRWSNCAGFWLLALNFFWMVLTRLLCHDFRLEYASALVYSLLFLLFFAFGTIFSERQQRFAFRIYALVFCAILFIWAVLGLYALFAGHGILRPACLFNQFGVAQEGSGDAAMLYVYYSRYHRNLSAIYFVTAIGLTVYLWFDTAGWLKRGLLLLVAAACSISVALQRSRSGYLAAAVCLALWAGLCLTKRFRLKALWQKAVLSVGMAVCAGVLFLSLGYIGDGLFSAAPAFDRQYGAQEAAVSALAEAPAEAAAAASAEAEEQTEQQDQQTEDTRELELTLNGRTYIWSAVLRCVRDYPSVLYKGTKQTTGMRMVRLYLEGLPAQHTHNMLLDQLLLAGLPGLLFYAGFLLLLLKRMVAEFFSPVSGENLPRRSLLCLLASVMVYGVFEPALSSPTMASLSFLLAAGIFCGACPSGGDPVKAE